MNFFEFDEKLLENLTFHVLCVRSTVDKTPQIINVFRILERRNVIKCGMVNKTLEKTLLYNKSPFVNSNVGSLGSMLALKN